jgi:hypothetical protein
MAEQQLDTKALASVLNKARMRLDEALTHVGAATGSEELGPAAANRLKDNLNTGCTNTGCSGRAADLAQQVE